LSEFPTLQRRFYSGSEIIYQENGRIHCYRADESKGLVKLTKTQKGRDAPAKHYFKLLAIVCRFLVHPKICKKYKLPMIDFQYFNPFLSNYCRFLML